MNNLLSNAFKFTGEGGRIGVKITSLSSSSRGDTRGVKITIADTGCGIPPEHINHVFDRFYHVEQNYKGFFQGTGIGLALTKELVELHSGTINVRSEPGTGTTFSIGFPLGKDHLKPEELVGGNTAKIDSIHEPMITEISVPENDFTLEKNINRQNNKPILLIVEDNPDMRLFIRQDFEETFTILEAIDGVDGFEKSAQYIPDIILSDVMMPKMDGNAFCNKVKSDERACHIPVILLTARALKESRIEGLETGADDFITKPFDREELQVRVENLISQRKKIRDHYRMEFEFSKDKTTEKTLNRDEKFIIKAKTIVEECMSNPEFGVDDFASQMAMSRVQLHRKLRAIVNNSATEFIRSLRLSRAVELLQKNDRTISEIAYDVGFNNLTYFSSSFNQKYGIPPIEYLKK